MKETRKTFEFLLGWMDPRIRIGGLFVSTCSPRSSTALLEFAQLAGKEPKAYLRQAAIEAIRLPGSVTLPRDF